MHYYYLEREWPIKVKETLRISGSYKTKDKIVSLKKKIHRGTSIRSVNLIPWLILSLLTAEWVKWNGLNAKGTYTL